MPRRAASPGIDRSMMVFMRSVVLRLAVLIMLTCMMGGQITELFDRWDDTLRTGQDIDYSVVFVAAAAGIVFVVANNLAARARRPLRSDATAPSAHAGSRASFVHGVTSDASASDPSPPPLLPLRI